MLHRPTYSRPQRLCVGTSRRTGKPTYCEGYGEWKFDEEYYEDSSEDEFDDTGFNVTRVRRHYWWEWNFDEAVAAELENLDDIEKDSEEALRVMREDESRWQSLIDLFDDNVAGVGSPR